MVIVRPLALYYGIVYQFSRLCLCVVGVSNATGYKATGILTITPGRLAIAMAVILYSTHLVYSRLYCNALMVVIYPIGLRDKARQCVMSLSVLYTLLILVRNS